MRASGVPRFDPKWLRGESRVRPNRRSSTGAVPLQPWCQHLLLTQAVAPYRADRVAGMSRRFRFRGGAHDKYTHEVNMVGLTSLQATNWNGTIFLFWMDGRNFGGNVRQLGWKCSVVLLAMCATSNSVASGVLHMRRREMCNLGFFCGFVRAVRVDPCE